METKNPFASITIWGGIMALIAAVLAGAHYQFSPEDQKTVADLIIMGINGVGTILTIYGRVNASKALSWSNKS